MNTGTLLQTQERVDYIDFAKSIGMLTVIWGHIALGFSATFLYTFHMPLFFFLSGMVFDKDKYPCFESFVRRRIHTLIVPYLIYLFITWVIWAGFSFVTHAQVESYWMPLLQTFIAQGSGGFLVHDVPLWFVTCLFVVEIAYFFLARCRDSINLTISVLLAALGYILISKVTFFDFTLMPWSIEVAMLALFFYSIGNMFVKYIGNDKFKSIVLKNRIVSVFCVIALFTMVYMEGGG